MKYAVEIVRTYAAKNIFTVNLCNLEACWAVVSYIDGGIREWEIFNDEPTAVENYEKTIKKLSNLEYYQI